MEHQELKEIANRKRFERDLWLSKTFFIIQLLFVHLPAVKCLKWPCLERNHLHWQWFEVLLRPLSWPLMRSEVLETQLHCIQKHGKYINAKQLWKDITHSVLWVNYESIAQRQHSQQLETGSFYGTKDKFNNTVFRWQLLAKEVLLFLFSLEHVVMSSYTCL